MLELDYEYALEQVNAEIATVGATGLLEATRRRIERRLWLQKLRRQAQAARRRLRYRDSMRWCVETEQRATPGWVCGLRHHGARPRGAGRPRAVASRASSRGGDSGDDGPGSSDPEPSSSARRCVRRACLGLPACGRAGR
jgi:hypothetical protein